MARKESHDAGERGGLSERMRKLIESATVEERRQASSENDSRPGAERRRRTDARDEPEKRAS